MDGTRPGQEVNEKSGPFGQTNWNHQKLVAATSGNKNKDILGGLGGYLRGKCSRLTENAQSR
jgi:hypothetical protein